MSWDINLENLSLLSDEELKRIKLVIDQESLERSKATLNSKDSISALEANFSSLLCSEPEIRDGALYAYGAKRKTSANNHICKFVSVNDKWAWESPSLIESSSRYADSDSKLQTLAIVQISDGDRVDVIESKANIIGHKAKKISSYTVKNGLLVKVSSRSIKIESRSGY
mgnify:CR=1 FL=1